MVMVLLGDTYLPEGSIEACGHRLVSLLDREVEMSCCLYNSLWWKTSVIASTSSSFAGRILNRGCFAILETLTSDKKLTDPK